MEVKTAALLLFALAVACTSGAVVPAEDAGVTSAGSDAGADAGASGCLSPANADGECPPEHARRVGAHAIDAKRRCRMPGEILGCQDASWNLTECRVRVSTGRVPRCASLLRGDDAAP